MTTTHTPAPWRIKRVANSKIHAVRIIGGDTFSLVATIQDVYPNDPHFTEGQADARLIAAAPELLEALEELYLLLKKQEGYQPYMFQARAAIAKAKG